MKFERPFLCISIALGQWHSQRGGQGSKLSYGTPYSRYIRFFFSNIENILCIFEKKILYTSNRGGHMIVWPLGPPSGYATGEGGGLHILNCDRD